MRKLLVLTTIFLTVLLSGCLNPFYDYAHNYTNIVWESTENSDLDVAIYVIEGNTWNNLGVLTIDDEIYYINAGIDNFLSFTIFNEDGTIGNTTHLSAHGGGLDKDVFKADIQSTSHDLFEGYKGRTIELTKRDFNEDEIKFYMYLNASIKSNDNSFESYSIINRDIHLHKIAFNTYGTFELNNILYDIKLKINIDNTFEIYDITTEELLFSGYIESNLKEGKFVFDNNIHGIEELEVTIDFMKVVT